jgi:cytochrome P450
LTGTPKVKVEGGAGERRLASGHDLATRHRAIHRSSEGPGGRGVHLVPKGNIVSKDPPRHRKLRTLVSQVFTPRGVASLAPRITEITTSLLNAADGADRFDLVDTLAYPLPITVIAELLGVPVQDQPRFRAWAEVLSNQQTVDATTLLTEELVNAMAPTVQEMNEYLLAHIQQRRQQPADDLIGKLIAAEVDGEQLADEEIMGFAGLLLLCC